MQCPVSSRGLPKVNSLSTRARKIASLLIGAFFVIVTTRLIIMEPVNQQYNQNNVSQFRHLLKTRSHPNSKHVNRTIKSCKNFAIFDAENHAGNLSFLGEQYTGWCVIVVNLKDVAKLSTCGGCLILKDEWIYSKVTKYSDEGTGNTSLLTNSHISKMAAYLYALEQGADWIFTTDRLHPIPYSRLSRFTENKATTGPIYQGPETFFEPCSHFVDHLSWREGGKDQVQGRYNIKVVSPHSLFQVVDSCARSDMRVNAETSFDNRAPAQYVMPGTYAVLDFRNVLVPRSNGWMLVASLLSRSERAKRTNTNTASPKSSKLGTQLDMLVQRMSWETDTTIGFIPGEALQSLCPSCDLHSQFQNVTENYLQALSRWRCDSFQDIPKCFIHMTKWENIILDSFLRLLVRIWVSLLERHTIPFIERIPFSEGKLLEKISGIPVYYSPANLLRRDPTNNSSLENPFQKLCQNHNSLYQPVIPKTHPVTNILLIIVFNFPFLVSHIPLLDYLYGRHFKHVAYCGESIVDFEERYQKLHPEKPVSFIEIKHYMGYWGQNCMSAAIKMGYDVTGYLQISDDVIMNIWNFDNLPYRKPWFQSNLRVAHIDREIVPDVWINRYWWPWSQFSGKNSAMAAFNHLESMVSDPVDGDKISAFMENLYNITNCNRCFLYEASDIFYVPRELASNFTFFSDILSYNKVFLEITIPTVLSGITSDKELYRLRGNYLWFYDRERYPYVYTEFDHFYHAWKLSQFRDKQQVRFFCRQVLSRIDNHLLMKDKS